MRRSIADTMASKRFVGDLVERRVKIQMLTEFRKTVRKAMTVHVRPFTHQPTSKGVISSKSNTPVVLWLEATTVVRSVQNLETDVQFPENESG